MKPLRLVGLLLLVLSVLLLLGALLAWASEPGMVPEVAGDASAGVYAALGVAALASGTVLLMLKPRPKAPAAAPAPPPASMAVEIKRTRMDAAPSAEAGGTAESAELEAVNQQLARLKVQYGLGEVGKETYRVRVEALEKQRAELELRLMGHGER